MIKLNDRIIERNNFPDGTPLLKLLPHVLNHGTNTLTWCYDDMSELFELYSITKQLQSKGILLRLVMPYVPNARQDRVQNEKEDVFTLKWFCDIINSLNFVRVTIYDIHSTVSSALINNCHCITNEKFITEVLADINEVDMVFYPDNGACKKYSEYIKMPYAFGIKHRNWEDGKITGLEVIGDVKDKNILIVDDICSKGGTFKFSADALLKKGAKNIYLAVSHCEHSIYDGELVSSDKITDIYTTDSIFTNLNTDKIIVKKYFRK